MFSTFELDSTPRGEAHLCAEVRRRGPGRRAVQFLGIAGLAIGFWLLGALLHGSSASAASTHHPPTVPVAVAAVRQLPAPTDVVDVVVPIAHRPVATVVHVARTLRPAVHRTVVTVVRPVLKSVPVPAPVTKTVRRVIRTVRQVPATIVKPTVGRIVKPARPTADRELAAPVRTVVKRLPSASSMAPAAVSMSLPHKVIPVAAKTAIASHLVRAARPANGPTASPNRPDRPVRQPAPGGWLPLAAGTGSTDSGTGGSAGNGAFALIDDRPRTDRPATSRRVGSAHDAVQGATAQRPSVSPD